MREFSIAVCSERKAGCQRSPAPSSSLDPRDRGRAEQRQPEAAVGAEGLLRGEVVGVGLGGVERQAAGAGGGVDEDQRVARVLAGAATSTMTPVEVSLWAQAITSAAGSAAGSGASPGSASTRIGSARKGAAGGRLGELLRELAVGEVQGALAHEPGGGGVPEGGRAAVAERDLVAVGQAEELAEARAHAADQVADRRLAVRGAHQRPTRSASFASASGRTFEGPQPKRPSAGFSSVGICGGGRRRSSRRRQVIDRAGGPSLELAAVA